MAFQFYKQFDRMDCGATCLKMIAKYYGRTIPLSILRDRCYVSKNGGSLADMCYAAESVGFRTKAIFTTFDTLASLLATPCIVHWNQKHFVVVYGLKKSCGKTILKVADPAIGLLKYDQEQFCEAWMRGTENEGIKKGVVLLMEPSPDFYVSDTENNNEEKWNLKFLFKYLKPYRKYAFQLFISILVASIINLILPFLTQSVVDIGIGNNDISFVVLILVAQVVLVIGQMANNLIRNWLMLHMTTRISISLLSDFLAKLMRLPIAFFDSKMIGDIMQRIGDYERIRTFLTNSMLSIIMACLAFIIYGCVMGGYDWIILIIYLSCSIAYILWIIIFLRERRKLDYMRFQQASANQSSLVQLISGMQEIKLNSCEAQKRWEWEKIQTKLFHISVKALTLGQTQEIGGTFIDQTKNVLVSFLAAKSVIDGDMTIGMMMAMQYILGQLNAPLTQFISFVQETQDAKLSMERLNEIQCKEDEEPKNNTYIKQIPSNSDIIFNNVSFRYGGSYSDYVLKNINITIPSQKTTAIVGPSGSGKTTLLKLMLGFYKPTEGIVTLGNKPIDKYSPSCWRKECGTVMQEGFIFSDTIAGNIGLSDATPDIEMVKKSAQIANISDFIEALPLQYNTRIGVDGHGLSVGQRQRLLIARAVYKDSNFLFFDEATNSLDANNEKIIMEQLQMLFNGKTAVVVAHRLSTVKNADNIIVLDRGTVVEQGTHNELTEKKGFYYQLVKNQLELGN